LKATEQPIDTGTAAGKCFFDMLGVFAEFETNLRKGRQLEGIAKAKANGVYKGRRVSIDAATVREMKGRGRPHRYRQGAWHRPGVCLPGAVTIRKSRSFSLSGGSATGLSATGWLWWFWLPRRVGATVPQGRSFL
jgi:hypothetical protein